MSPRAYGVRKGRHIGHIEVDHVIRLQSSKQRINKVLCAYLS